MLLGAVSRYAAENSFQILVTPALHFLERASQIISVDIFISDKLFCLVIFIFLPGHCGHSAGGSDVSHRSAHVLPSCQVPLGKQ